MEIVILIEKHTFKKTHEYFAELDKLCFLAKNLYNATLYDVRQEYIKSNTYLNYYAINKIFTDKQQADYVALPRKVSKEVQKLVDKSYKSFFALLKKKTKGQYDKPVKLPQYKDPKTGRQVLHYDKQALSFRTEGFVKLSQTNIFIKTDKENIRYVRIVPKGNHINVEVAYKVDDVKKKENNNVAAIDLGVKNLATVVGTNFHPFIISGKPLLSINQYCEKYMAKIQSVQNLNGYKNRTNRMQTLQTKRNNKINDYLHKATTKLANQLDSNDISKVYVGYNEGWKQDVDLGRTNNQNFCKIPFLTFIQMLTYKCELSGIEVKLVKEHYTSKCSFLDGEEVKKHKEYVGERIKRGLFKTQKGLLINADVNAACNILQKETRNVSIANQVEGCRTPLVFTINR